MVVWLILTLYAVMLTESNSASTYALYNLIVYLVHLYLNSDSYDREQRSTSKLSLSSNAMLKLMSSFPRGRNGIKANGKRKPKRRTQSTEIKL